MTNRDKAVNVYTLILKARDMQPLSSELLAKLWGKKRNNRNIKHFL